MTSILKYFLKFLVFICFSILIFSCARPKKNYLSYSQLAEFKKGELSLKGIIWWKLDLLRKNNSVSYGGLADFQINKKFLYITLKSPIGSSLGFIKWKNDHPDKLKIYDCYHKILYIIKIPQKSENLEIPFYFLGLKSPEKSFNFQKIHISYSFFNKEKKGSIVSSHFKLIWKIKKITPIQNEKIDITISNKNFKTKLINFY